MALCGRCGSKLSEAAEFCSTYGQAASRTTADEDEADSDELGGRVKETTCEEKVTKVIVEDSQGKSLPEVSATAGLVDSLLSLWLAAPSHY